MQHLIADVILFAALVEKHPAVHQQIFLIKRLLHTAAVTHRKTAVVVQNQKIVPFLPLRPGCQRPAFGQVGSDRHEQQRIGSVAVDPLALGQRRHLRQPGIPEQGVELQHPPRRDRPEHCENRRISGQLFGLLLRNRAVIPVVHPDRIDPASENSAGRVHLVDRQLNRLIKNEALPRIIARPQFRRLGRQNIAEGRREITAQETSNFGPGTDRDRRRQKQQEKPYVFLLHFSDFSPASASCRRASRAKTPSCSINCR